MNQNKFVMIIAGGVGSRLWPESTENFPKQFLDVLGTGDSLITLTYKRFQKLVPQENIFVITNKQYRDLCLEQLDGIAPENILLEPSRNNTAPSVAYAAYRLRAIKEDAVFIVAPSDHVIEKEDVFLENVEKAFEHVIANDSIITLGITPTRPETGYGYIETRESKEIRKVISFKEKPDKDLAQKYLDEGTYLWNAGIFVWSANGIIKSFEKYAPEITNVLGQDLSIYNTDDEQSFINLNYPNTPNISVDYAILEKANNIYTIPSDIGWSDLGTWSSLHLYLNKDEDDNVVQTKALTSIDVKNSIVRIPNKDKVVIKGLEDYIVIINDDAVLIYPKNEEQNVKVEVKNLDKE